MGIAAVLLSALCAADYLQVVVSIVRRPAKGEPLCVPALVCAVALLMALATLALGIYPPILAWVSRLGL